MHPHTRNVIDQFTRQAVPFSKLPGHADANRLLIEQANIGPDDEVLDVACGPGLLVCAIAPHARHVTGIDLTPAMIERARALQAEQGLANVDWQVGDATPLPFPEARFDVVLTRYSLHHFLDPEHALAEMVRVCRRGGRVLVADLILPPEKAEHYDVMEKLRDPSHVRLLREDELPSLIAGVGLCEVRRSGYQFDMSLDTLLKGSFPNPGDGEKVRALFEADVDVDRLGLGARASGDDVLFSYPITVVVGKKSA
jgi:ubiquinone/menaquinone biosynthesis C-methylase UbiE